MVTVDTAMTKNGYSYIQLQLFWLDTIQLYEDHISVTFL